ncbi:uncharacterized protein [Epargyreus clarus]|uniref:uncharacterized protein n=1 Tax=Epargyreus clarus TaxID=520877 RepID=UPI003C2DDC69
MSVKKGKGPVFDPGLCRCCGAMRKCRVLNVEYESSGQKEVYCDMIMDCFGLLLAHLDGKPNERLICATCVQRLREAFTFRQQVLRCEEVFIQMKMDNSVEDSRIEQATVEGAPKVETDIVKEEPMERDPSPCRDALADDMSDYQDAVKSENDDSNSNDDMPLQQMITNNSNRHTDTTKLKLNDGKTENTTDLDRRKTLGEHKSELVAKYPKIEEKVWRPQSVNGATTSRRIVIGVKKKNIPMSKLQQIMRERDPTYMTETNILTIVEYSYICPFKCRHNHLLCYYCGQNYSDPADLRTHTQSSHHPKKFKVTEHKNMVKMDITRIDCRLCDAKIDDLDEFKRHITSVHKKSYYFEYKDSVLPFKLTKDELRCAICAVLFPYFHALNKHMNEHYSNYVCETCGLGFVDKGRFVMHQQRHEEGDYPCEVCGKVFKASYNRDLHIDRVHKKRGRVYCPKCDVMLMSYPQKLKHLVEVHGEAPMSFPCTMCEKVFDTRRMLTIHKRKDHLKDYRYECQICGQKFFTRFALTNHMPTHTGERNFKCKVCEKTYPRLKTLKDHMRIHTNDRRYRCHICGQAFIQNCSLKGHVKSQHPEYG